MRTVCLVEDDPDLRQDLVELLEIAGTKATAYENAEACLNWLDSAKQDPISCFKLFLVDLTLPGMGGRQFVATLRQRGIESPILVLSGESKTDEIDQFLNLHKLHFMPKPFKFEVFLAKVSNLMLEGAGAVQNER